MMGSLAPSTWLENTLSGQVDFETYAQRLTSRLVPLGAFFIVLTTVLFWPVDLLVFDLASPYQAAFARMRLGLLASAGLTVSVFTVFPKTRRYGVTALVAMTLSCVASAALTVGAVWDPQHGTPAPWLYSAYLLPLSSLPALVRRGPRVAVTFGTTFGGLALFLFVEPRLVEQHLAGIPLATVVFACIFSVGLGDVIYRLLRGNYEKRKLLQQERQQLRDVVKSLERQLTRSGSSLERMTDNLARARTQERLHLSREIHDELGQLLSGLRIETALVGKQLDNPSRVEHFIGTVDELLGHALGAVDAIIKGLRFRAVANTEGDLTAAVRSAITEFRRRTGIGCQLVVADEQFNLDQTTLVEVHRIVKESLTNVMRHAAAAKVEIRCDHVDGDLRLTVRDDGCGFRVSKLDHSSRYGVVGMKERAHAIGGRLVVDSQRGQGTTVKLDLPLLPHGV